MNSTADSRRHPRYPCSDVAEISVKTGESAGASYVALVTDICVKGMRISMDGLISVDSEVVVIVPGNSEFVGAVRHVREDGREYSMGIEFIVGEWNELSDWPQHRSTPELHECQPGCRHAVVLKNR